MSTVKPSLAVDHYSSEVKGIWDSFARTSKNGSFLFARDYMDYHSHRFEGR